MNRTLYSAFFSLLLTLSIVSVAQGQEQDTSSDYDPLRNTKKLIVEGHKSLYENGAFHIPNTQISLIPAGPSATEFAAELLGLRARQSFIKSVKNAADSVQIISIGTEKTYGLSKAVFEGGQDFANTVTKHSREGGVLLMKRSVTDAKEIIGQSWDLAKTSSEYIWEAGGNITESSLRSARQIRNSGTNDSRAMFENSIEKGQKLSSSSVSSGAQTIKDGGKEFIKGYAALPSQLNVRAEDMSPVPTWKEFNQAAKEVDQWREKKSDEMAFFISDTTTHYWERIDESFSKSKVELNRANETGSLAILKSLGWVLHGIVSEGIVKPAANITKGALGYVAVNAVVYPVMLVGEGATSLMKVAVKVTWNSGAMVYDIVAPTVKAAVAGVIGAAEAAGGTLAGGAIMAGGTIGSGATYVGNQVTAATVATTGTITGETVKYVGVPLAASGIVVGSTAVGVTVGAGEAIAGAGTLVAGETIAVGAQAATTVVAGATMVTGTAVSTVGGVGYGIYELSKAVVVPTGYTLSSGVVLSYGSISQLAAHSILAVTDGAYLVLSMEGPNWVIYSVKDVFGMGDQLPAGTVLDLEAMQSQGEEFKRLPVTKEEMDAVIEQIPQDLQPAGM